MPMARLSTEGHKLLQEMAEHRGLTQQQVLDEALATLRRKQFFEDGNRAYAEVRGQAESARLLDEERELFEGAIGDGIPAE